ncbi:MAG: DUF853 family protein [Bacteroidales bacterium]|uniref:helicase HerA-like domain-containing protein n=1 Tax=Porphyromonas sp. TaxID=1924944 RepID=UPI00297B6D93|nr:helicase HerA-like domain-containing protein [Porphyromonas sp.]MDD7438840.1 DUF853 family protein [Bacteroidales bacterium]MDY3066544.1 helicase HerA-like domain-containing protein [Porphyromonas sp.]
MIENKEQLPLIGYNGETFVGFVPKMMNRHGLIAGATGTGKTVTLQSLAETFSQMGTAVFATDMKGDLSGIAKMGGNKESVTSRVAQYGLEEKGFGYTGFPVEFWDVFGEQGNPLRLSVSSLGPLLLERLLGLNETQGGVLNIIFRIADEQGLLLIDLDDLQTMVRFVGDNRKEFITSYGNISTASIGAIQRALMRLESEGGHQFFGMPDLDPADLFRQIDGKGVVNILAADKLSRSPRIYSTLLLWLLSNLFENLPEVGDLDRPKMVFFFDEAHLLFNDISPVLQDKVEQIVRLIRSKGVGVYFITQTPSDVPESILGQLGNRVLHALRAYTPNDQKAIRAAADGFRPNPKFEMQETIMGLGTGEAIVSMLEPKGAPSIAERVAILPPQSFIGSLSEVERKNLMMMSSLFGKYAQEIDPESAHEILSARMLATQEEAEALAAQKEKERQLREQQKAEAAAARAKRNEPKSFVEEALGSLFKTTKRQVTTQIGREITRTIFGTFFGKRR